MRSAGGKFASIVLTPEYGWGRLTVFGMVAGFIVSALWSLSKHPITNKSIMTDAEVDLLYRECHKYQYHENESPYVGIFIPFGPSQVDLIELKIRAFLSAGRSPCNMSKPGVEANRTDIVLFFIGDPQKHPNVASRLLKAFDQQKKTKSGKMVIRSGRKCFDKIVFRSLRDLDVPSEITISDLFYGVTGSDLLRGYTHIVWMDASAAPLRSKWVKALHDVIAGEPFWVLGAMTSSRQVNHYDRGYYHMHINAVYKIADPCFINFLKRVHEAYRGMTPDLAIHLYRTDFANFREAQHVQHLFRYSRLFTALDTHMAVVPDVRARDWPGTYFVIQDRHYARFGRGASSERAENSDLEENEEENFVENEVKKDM